MSENDKKEDPERNEGTFDIYHFFSRWDILAAAAFIIILLLLTVYFVFLQPSAA